MYRCCFRTQRLTSSFRHTFEAVPGNRSTAWTKRSPLVHFFFEAAIRALEYKAHTLLLILILAVATVEVGVTRFLITVSKLVQTTRNRSLYSRQESLSRGTTEEERRVRSSEREEVGQDRYFSENRRVGVVCLPFIGNLSVEGSGESWSETIRSSEMNPTATRHNDRLSFRWESS